MALDRYNSIAYKLKDDARKSVGIYHWKGGEVNSGQIIVETGQECTDIDAKGVAPNGTSLLVESVAIEIASVVAYWLYLLLVQLKLRMQTILKRRKTTRETGVVYT